jgi:hypothetical protein
MWTPWSVFAACRVAISSAREHDFGNDFELPVEEKCWMDENGLLQRAAQ